MGLQCEQCTEPTKRPVGFWDGDNCGGYMWDCDNLNCPVKQERESKRANETAAKSESHRLNQKHGINIDKMKRLRRGYGETIRDMSRILNVSSAEYSEFETERKPMPVDIYKVAMAYLGGDINVH